MGHFLRMASGCATIALAGLSSASRAEETGAPANEQPEARILVTGKHLREDVNSGKDDIPLIELPQAISIVTADQLKLRGVTRLSDVLFSVAGASRSSTYGFYDSWCSCRSPRRPTED